MEPQTDDGRDAARAEGSVDPPAGFVSCDETIEKLYVYLDGELTEQRRIEIARHLDLCGPCVGAFGFEAELRKLVADRCQDRVPDALLARVAAAIQAESGPSSASAT